MRTLQQHVAPDSCSSDTLPRYNPRPGKLQRPDVGYLPTYPTARPAPRISLLAVAHLELGASPRGAAIDQPPRPRHARSSMIASLIIVRQWYLAVDRPPSITFGAPGAYLVLLLVVPEGGVRVG